MSSKTKKLLTIFILPSLILVSLAATAHAVTIGVENPLGYDNVEKLSDAIRSYLLYIVGGIAIIFIAIAGILYIVGGASQNDGLVNWAKKGLTGTIIGLAIILGAKIIIDEAYFIVLGQERNFSNLSASQMLMRGINFLLVIVGTLFLISMIIGGIWYFASTADESKAELGKKTITNSIIGLIIALSAMLVINQISVLIGK